MTEPDTNGRLQYFEWGSILWFVDPGNLDTGRLSVGIVTFHAYAVENEHVHSGHEQVIYVMAGSGVQIINEVEYTLKQGDIKHIPPYSRHKVINRSAGELKVLIVYSPVKFQVGLEKPLQLQAKQQVNPYQFLDAHVVRGLLNRLAESVDLSLALLDINGKLMVKTENYPRFCHRLYEASNHRHCRERFRKASAEISRPDKPYLFECCSGVTGIIMPLHSGNEITGYVVYGQVFLTKADMSLVAQEIERLAGRFAIAGEDLLRLFLNIRLVPKNRLYSAAEAILVVANYITDMVVDLRRQKELDNSRLSLMEEQMAKANLEKALHEADFKLLQSQIQPHFLFNTLNTIAQMAYIDSADRVAELVWSLADLLKATLKKSEKLIPLAEELSILKSYLHIQSTRFGERLVIELDVQPGLEHVLIPCMLIQPLVENAIIHGFGKEVSGGKISITVCGTENYLCCTVADNGSGFAPDDKCASTRGCNKIGLSSVENRLNYYFKGDYLFQITSAPNQGTKIDFSFPIADGDRDA